MTSTHFDQVVADVAEYMIQENIRRVYIPRLGASPLVLELKAASDSKD